MKIKLSELRGRLADRGEGVSLQEVEEATGISRKALTKISKGRMNILRPEYIDALCTYFDIDAGELVEAERVSLPLDLNIRPDRHGAQVGEKTRTP